MKQVKCSTDFSATFLQIFQSSGEGKGEGERGGGKGGLLITKVGRLRRTSAQ